MLAEVRVRDFALLESVDVSLSPGLNVVSGETGEGKSLLLRAIAQMLGARARKGLVREGAGRASVEGRFLLDGETRRRVAAVCDLLEDDAQEVCLRRVITAEGTSRAYVDGCLVPVRVLAAIGSALVDVHGQAEHLSLLRSREQAALLDRFGGIGGMAAEYAELHRKLADVEGRLSRAAEEEIERRDRVDLLRLHLSELRELEPRADEASRLDAEIRIAERAGDLARALRGAASDLTEAEGSVGEVCARALRALEGVAPDEKPFSVLMERLESLRLEAEDLGRECAAVEGGIDQDPARLAELLERRERLLALARRHRVDPDALAELARRIEAELTEVEAAGDVSAALEEERGRLARAVELLGAKLLAARRKAAARLEKEVMAGLRELRMPRARFQVRTEAEEGSPRAGSQGPGAARFFVSANPGEKARPMEEVASGGEAARILLAVRGALAGHHRVPLLVFDEIDAGLGGRVGLPFGRRVAAIAAHHQVLLVTHLPQVAAFASSHLRVSKEIRGGRTRTRVTILREEERLEELAAMLGGEIAPRAARDQARALLEEAAAG